MVHAYANSLEIVCRLRYLQHVTVITKLLTFICIIDAIEQVQVRVGNEEKKYLNDISWTMTRDTLRRCEKRKCIIIIVQEGGETHQDTERTTHLDSSWRHQRPPWRRTVAIVIFCPSFEWLLQPSVWLSFSEIRSPPYGETYLFCRPFIFSASHIRQFRKYKTSTKVTLLIRMPNWLPGKG